MSKKAQRTKMKATTTGHAANADARKRLDAHDAVTSTLKTGPYVRTIKKIGRNEKCPCGSGKKYKNCHMSTRRPLNSNK